jgi:hypothetical protein
MTRRPYVTKFNVDVTVDKLQTVLLLRVNDEKPNPARILKLVTAAIIWYID